MWEHHGADPKSRSLCPLFVERTSLQDINSMKAPYIKSMISRILTWYVIIIHMIVPCVQEHDILSELAEQAHQGWRLQAWNASRPSWLGLGVSICPKKIWNCVTCIWGNWKFIPGWFLSRFETIGMSIINLQPTCKTNQPLKEFWISETICNQWERWY